MPAWAEWATMTASHVEKERKKLTGLAKKKKKASRAMWGGEPVGPVAWVSAQGYIGG
jgi:hypothetical protein